MAVRARDSARLPSRKRRVSSRKPSRTYARAHVFPLPAFESLVERGSSTGTEPAGPVPPRAMAPAGQSKQGLGHSSGASRRLWGVEPLPWGKSG